MAFSIDDKKIQAPLAGAYAPSQSLVQGPGWNPFNDPLAEEGIPGGGGSSGGYTLGGGGQYRGRIGADTSNLPPSQRGLYENSAPSLEAIQGAYDANLKNGMTHDEIMTMFNDQADRDKAWWAEGFAKDPNFSQTLYNESQRMLGTNQVAKQKLYENATKKNTQGVTVNDQLRASRGAFSTPTLGPTAGSFTAPLSGGNSRRVSDPNTAALAALRTSRQNKSAIASRPRTQSAQYSNFGRFR